MELMEEAKKLISEHVKKEVDPKVLEIMEYVLTAILLTFNGFAREKLPSILDDLHIFAENKSISEIARDNLDNFIEEEKFKFGDAGVIRSIVYDEDDASFIEEDRHLLISLKDGNNYYTIILKVIHEFIHLLRFGGIILKGTKYKVKDGISIAQFDAKNKNGKRKYMNLEEGIVQEYTNKALHNLYEYISGYKIDSNIYRVFIREYKRAKFDDLLLEVKIIETLSQDSKFKEYVELSFTEEEIPSQLVQYFNSVLESTTACLELDRLLESIRFGDGDESEIENLFRQAMAIVSAFSVKTNSRKRLL